MAQYENLLSQVLSVKRIMENSKEQQKIIYKTLKKILENVLNNPTTNEYRKVHLLSENIVENLMPYSGGLEFLFEIGFVEADDNLLLPDTVNLNTLKAIKDELEVLFDKNDSSSDSIMPKRNENSNYLLLAENVSKV